VAKMERSSTGKVVPIRTTSKGLEVCIMKPAAFDDSQEICDMLLTGRAIVINVLSVTLGFLVLIFSDLVPLQRFGLLIGVTMLTSGFSTLTLLAAVMNLKTKK
jgi:hypothetical protein